MKKQQWNLHTVYKGSAIERLESKRKRVGIWRVKNPLTGNLIELATLDECMEIVDKYGMFHVNPSARDAGAKQIAETLGWNVDKGDGDSHSKWLAAGRWRWDGEKWSEAPPTEIAEALSVELHLSKIAFRLD